MFRCAITNKLSRQGDPRTGTYMYVDERTGDDTHAPEKPHRLVVQTRPRVYKKRVLNEEKRVYEDVEVGYGSEIVHEIDVCQEGLELWNSWSETQQAAWVRARFGEQ